MQYYLGWFCNFSYVRIKSCLPCNQGHSNSSLLTPLSKFTSALNFPPIIGHVWQDCLWWTNISCSSEFDSSCCSVLQIVLSGTFSFMQILFLGFNVSSSSLVELFSKCVLISPSSNTRQWLIVSPWLQFNISQNEPMLVQTFEPFKVKAIITNVWTPLSGSKTSNSDICFRSIQIWKRHKSKPEH